MIFYQYFRVVCIDCCVDDFSSCLPIICFRFRGWDGVGQGTVLAGGMWTECTFGSGPHFASVLSHLGGSGHQNEIPCTHPPSPNPCDSEYDHFGACRTVSEAIGGLGRASPQGADAGEPLAIFLPFWDFWTIFGKCEKSEIRNQK